MNVSHRELALAVALFVTDMRAFCRVLFNIFEKSKINLTIFTQYDIIKRHNLSTQRKLYLCQLINMMI
jgi:hypothetical protein